MKPGQPGSTKTNQGFLVCRGLALFFAVFSMLNLAGDFFSPGFDANLWWIDLRVLPPPLWRTLLFLTGLALLWFGLRPPNHRWACQLIAGSTGLLALISLANALQFFAVAAASRIHAGVPIPLSLLTSGSLALVALCALRRPDSFRPHSGLVIAGAALACAVLFPFLQMIFFGKTDYSRPADVAVVFGARAYADGRPSDALADRVRTACRLYREGTVKRLIFSGGPGDGAVHETVAMARMAVRLGVATEDILTDEQGLNTQATVRNTVGMLDSLGASRVLVISHFYHLPRIKLAYARAGREVYTVPATESYFLTQLPYNMAREVAALWVYYLHPLVPA